MHTHPTPPRARIAALAVLALLALTAACSDDSGGTDDGGNNTATTNNSTTSTNAGSTGTNNGSTGTNNSSTGTTGTNNTTTSTNNSTTSTNNSTTSTNNSTTTPFEGVGLALSDAARACELVLLDPNGALQAVTFDASVEGRDMRRGARVAIAFHAVDDAPILGGAVAFDVTEGQADTLQVTAPRCFDAAGDPLSGDDVLTLKLP